MTNPVSQMIPTPGRFKAVLTALILLKLVLIGALLFSGYTGDSMVRKYTPLIDAAMEIKLEATTAHLAFMELLADDQETDLDTVAFHLDRSIWYTRAMLFGDSNSEGAFRPVTNPELIRALQQVLEEQTRFKEQVLHFWDAHFPKVDNLPLHDPELDSIFTSFIEKADLVESRLQKRIAADMTLFERTQILLLGIVLALSGAVIALLLRFARSRNTALREHQAGEKSLEITLRSIGDGVLSTDTRGRITRMNPVAETLTGWSEEEAFARPVNEVFRIRNCVTRDEVQNPVDLVLSSGKVIGLANHTELLPRSGEPRQIADSGSPIRDDNDKIVGVVLVFRDVTEEYRRTREIAEGQALVQSIFRSAPVGIGMVKERVLIKVNDRMAGMLGMTKEELEGKPARILYPTDKDSDYVKKEKYAQIKEHGTGTVETRWLHKDGRILDILLSSTPVDLKDWSRGVTFSALDITEQKEWETALQAAKTKAETASRAKSSFLANMSHELRTPLNGLLGMMQLLQTTPMDEEQQEYTRKALLSGTRLTDLIGDILDLSRIESGKITLQNNPFRPCCLIHELEDLFGLAAGNQNLDLQIECDENIPPRLLGDEQRLRQVLYNLVGNALKFTPSGFVRVSATRLPDQAASRCHILFTVKDSGIGIARENQDRIFETFTQSENTFTRRYQGAGLGLSIVKELVILMGGTITLSSEPGHGTEFCLSIPFSLPLAKNRPSPRTDSRKKNQAGMPETALVVEDDPVSRAFLQRMLEKQGLAVTVADNGRSALDLLMKTPVDCIFMDIQMPVMDGVQATRTIRTAPEFTHLADVPIVALTAYAMSGDREKFLAQGMSGYLSKPASAEQLEQVLNGLHASPG